ncbi:hypothetical protein OSB04_022120 [Centaurea solstitialis]|uniref:Uncharacterized protein n=1 Tax=Centaurea solstitialis TaxID=347529 RepID=A0AA38W5L4_9ASTR|nr:hypothetical protein OSB04_022120 [Centaurea solstitialis]
MDINLEGFIQGNRINNLDRVLAFRKARYAEDDEPYFLAFGMSPVRPKDPIAASNNEEISLSRLIVGDASERKFWPEMIKKGTGYVDDDEEEVNKKNFSSSIFERKVTWMMRKGYMIVKIDEESFNRGGDQSK